MKGGENNQNVENKLFSAIHSFNPKSTTQKPNYCLVLRSLSSFIEQKYKNICS